jgi:HAD superfamily hydrolase (TIGR01509 family)
LIAVAFDLDGVLLDSEQTWDDARRRYVADHGGRWEPSATPAMMGMSSPEWARYLREELAVPEAPAAISAGVVALVLAAYRQHLPLMTHARETVWALRERWPLGLASSSNRPVIEAFLDASGLRPAFAAVVSSEEVAHGKPAPDVYLAAARLLGVAPDHCVAVEDSTNGIRAALAAATRVVAVPNRQYPPDPAVLEAVDVVVASLAELSPEVVERITGR